MFGHIPEILALLLVALLVFGPKRMVEMGSQVGKAVREFRDSTKGFSWTNLLSMDEHENKPSTPPVYTPESADSYVEGTITNNPPATASEEQTAESH
jgi:sec-independent protein translocase protein TatA